MFTTIDVNGAIQSVTGAWQSVEMARVTASVEIAKIQSTVNLTSMNLQWSYEMVKNAGIALVVIAVISFFIWAFWWDARKNS